MGHNQEAKQGRLREGQIHFAGGVQLLGLLLVVLVAAVIVVRGSSGLLWSGFRPVDVPCLRAYGGVCGELEVRKMSKEGRCGELMRKES